MFSAPSSTPSLNPYRVLGEGTLRLRGIITNLVVGQADQVIVCLMPATTNFISPICGGDLTQSRTISTIYRLDLGS